MKLAAKLAYSQLKINRSRTVWTLIGIVLSTALITAVCSFAASGNALIVYLLGENSDNYGGKFAPLFLAPAGILSVIIVSVSVIVISNSFRISAGDRTAQLGMLKSVGATKRQITDTVMFESIFLSMAGIPIGIILGLVIAFAGVRVANRFLGEINSLVHMMMNELIIVIEYVIAWQALIAAALISFLTVLISAWLPARKAAKITAIESIRGMGEVKIEAKRIHTSPLTQKLFGFEGTLAAKDIKRNKRNFRATTITLTISIILFINLSALSGLTNAIERMMYSDIEAEVMVDYTSALNRFINEDTGREENVIISPVDSETGERVAEILREYKDTVVFGYGDDMETYDAIVPREMITTMMAEAHFGSEEQPEYEVSAEILTIDKENYAMLCERAGVPIGSNILLNRYAYNDNGEMAVITPFLFEEQSIRLIKADNSIHEIQIDGVLAQDDVPPELLGYNVSVVRLIVPQTEKLRGYAWYAAPADINGFMDYANAVMGEMFPRSQDAAYMELGFTTRVYKIKDYIKVMNIPIILGIVFVYGFVVLLTLIGLTSVISTISANVRMRSREFAVLQSVGMTRSGLNRMLNFESIINSTKSLIIGLPVAIALTYLINIPIRAVFPIPYQIPWLSAALCTTVILVITWVTIRYSASRMRDKNIVETIRSESGR